MKSIRKQIIICLLFVLVAVGWWIFSSDIQNGILERSYCRDYDNEKDGYSAFIHLVSDYSRGEYPKVIENQDEAYEQYKETLSGIADHWKFDIPEYKKENVVAQFMSYEEFYSTVFQDLVAYEDALDSDEKNAAYEAKRFYEKVFLDLVLYDNPKVSKDLLFHMIAVCHPELVTTSIDEVIAEYCSPDSEMVDAELSEDLSYGTSLWAGISNIYRGMEILLEYSGEDSNNENIEELRSNADSKLGEYISKQREETNNKKPSEKTDSDVNHRKGGSGNSSDPYDADRYDEPDDFADDWEDDFDSWDDAYEYWEDYMN